MMTAAFSLFGAAGQIMLLLMGLLFFGLGALMIFYPILQFLTWPRVKARIVEVRGRKSAFADKQVEALPEDPPATSFSTEFKKSPGTDVLALLVAFLVLGVPLLFVGVGSYFALDYIYLKTQGIETQGRIVRFDERESDEGGSTYAPVIEFRDPSGILITEPSRISSSHRMGMMVGQSVGVFYERDKPAHFIIDHFWYNMILPLGFAGLGGLVLFILFFRGARRDLPPKNKTLTQSTSNIYYPTYEYMTPDGRLVRAEGDGGSSSLADKIPGTDVMVFLKKDDFESPSQPSFLLTLFGLMFAAPGVFILSLAITQLELSLYTLIAGIVILGYFGYKIFRNIKPRAEWDNRESFRTRMKAKRAKKREGSVLLSPHEFDVLLQQRDRMMLLWTPLYILITIGMMVGGLYLYNNQKEFQSGAVVAQGTVARLISQHDSDGTKYYPLISFQTAEGVKVEFRDKVGSNPPSASEGDSVKVLYQPDSPEEAIIDRGWMNQLPGAGLMLAGAVLFMLLARSFLAARERMARQSHNFS